MTIRNHLTTILILICGATGGMLANLAGLPMPFLIGSLIASAIIASLLSRSTSADYKFPHGLRVIFLNIIGLMIGSQVSADLWSLGYALLACFVGLTFFVGIAHYTNFIIFTRLGRYDPMTAFLAGLPGGLMESIAMAEEFKANLSIVMIQQFLRIIIVIIAVPIGISIWVGHPVGSAGGMTLSRGPVDWVYLPLIVAAGTIGYLAAKSLHFPAAVLTGPLLISALITITGIFPINLPQWLINDAQVVIGSSLGMRFIGLFGRQLLTACLLTMASVSAMLAFGAAFAFGIHILTGLHFDALFVGFAPGGVTEMSLIALSLAANPAFVTAMHVYRIVVTVFMTGYIVRTGRVSNLQQL